MRSLRILGGVAALVACLLGESSPLVPCGGPLRPPVAGAAAGSATACDRLAGCGTVSRCDHGGSAERSLLRCACCHHPQRSLRSAGSPPALLPGAPAVALPGEALLGRADPSAGGPGTVPAIAPPPPRA